MMAEADIVNLVVIGVISWSTAFLLARRIIFPNRSFDFCNRIVSTIHASVAVTLSCLSVQHWRCPVCPLDSRSLYLACNEWVKIKVQIQALAVSLAYLIYDLICCLFDDKHIKLDNSIHHLVSIIGITAGLAYKKCGSEMVAAICLTEMSSPFLHMRELLKELGHKDTDLNLAADILFALIFSFARMIGGPYLTYVTLSADNPFVIKAMALGLQLVSASWFYNIVRMVKYKLTERTSTKVSL